MSLKKEYLKYRDGHSSDRISDVTTVNPIDSTRLTRLFIGSWAFSVHRRVGSTRYRIPFVSRTRYADRRVSSLLVPQSARHRTTMFTESFSRISHREMSLAYDSGTSGSATKSRLLIMYFLEFLKRRASFPIPDPRSATVLVPRCRSADISWITRSSGS